MRGARTEEAPGDLLIRAIAADEGVLGDHARFGPLAAEVADAARAAGDAEAEVVALKALAWSHRNRLDNVAALRLLDRAATVARRARLPHRLGDVLTVRAAVSLELGRARAAARDLALAGGLVPPEAVPEIELKRAALQQGLGQVATAAATCRRVLAHPASTVATRTRAANNLALAECLRGRADRALEHIELAARLAGEVGPVFVAMVAHNRGVVLVQAGRIADGLRRFDEAAQLLAGAGLPLGEFFVEHAETLAALRLLPEARELAARAADELERHDVPLMAAEARLRVADTALLAGDADAALAAARRAIGLFRRQRRPGWTALATVVAVEAARRSGRAERADLDRACRAADTLARLGTTAAVQADLVTGRVAAELGRTAVAQRRWRAACERSRTGPVLVRVRGRLAGALAAAAQGDDRAVLAHCRAGIADLAAHRAALASMELRALASGHGVELGRLGLDVLLRSRRPARVLDWTERTRAAALLAVEPPVAETVSEERAAVAALHRELADARRGTGAEPADLLARQTEIEARIRRATWRRTVAQGAPGRPSSARAIRDVLGDHTLVSYVRHRGEVLAVVADRRRTRLVALGSLLPLRFEADALLFALRRLTRPGPGAALDSARASAEYALARLRRGIVEPLGVDPGAPLVVVPIGGAHRVPWSALHPGPVSVAPSASAWAATRARSAGEGPVVVVAGPDLPAAEREAAAVAARHPRPTVLASAAATTAAVLDAMAGAGLVHLACHGELRADNPIFTGLRMADGPLTVHELDLRGVAPHRIVLAACDSAADATYAGDELLGFVSALLARGTAGIVASVVAVGDVESVGLMDQLHRGLAAGGSMAGALHAARATLDPADPRQFVNWCAFTAYGAG